MQSITMALINSVNSSDGLRTDLRQENVPHDFIIKVESEELPVHQKILTSKSDYFRAMLELDTKEKQQGFVDIQILTLAGVKECIEYMYTAKVNVIAENAEAILQAADMIQLSQVREICVDYFDNKLQRGNCVSTLLLAMKYSCSELQEKSQTLYAMYFNMEITEILQLEKNDFRAFLETHDLDNEVAWNGIINWVKHDSEKRKKFILEFVKLLDWTKYPSVFLLTSMWNESLFTTTIECKNIVFRKIFYDAEEFKSKICFDNCLIVRRLSREYEHISKQVEDIINEFMIYFDRIAIRDEFKLLSIEDVMYYFKDSKVECLSSEIFKWKTMLEWIRYKPQHRKSHFPSFMKWIEFSKIPNDFIRSEVLDERLIKEFPKSRRAVMDAVFDKETLSKQTEDIAVVCENGTIQCLSFKSPAPCTTFGLLSSNKWRTINAPKITNMKPIVFSLNGRLCCLTGNQLFFYGMTQKWLERSSIPGDVKDSRRVVSIKDRVFVIQKDEMFIYKCLEDKWEQTDGCGFDVFCATVHKNHVYVFNSTGNKPGAKIYNTTQHMWDIYALVNPPLVESLTCWKSDIYGLWKNQTNYRYLMRLNQVTSNWEQLRVIPSEQSIKFMCIVNDHLIFFHFMNCYYINKGCYYYNELCTIWQKLEIELPSGDISSLCSFSSV